MGELETRGELFKEKFCYHKLKENAETAEQSHELVSVFTDARCYHSVEQEGQWGRAKSMSREEGWHPGVLQCLMECLFFCVTYCLGPFLMRTISRMTETLCTNREYSLGAFSVSRSFTGSAGYTTLKHV